MNLRSPARMQIIPDEVQATSMPGVLEQPEGRRHRRPLVLGRCALVSIGHRRTSPG
jgi:hypothetical protein